MDVNKRRSFIINFLYVLILALIALAILRYALPLLSPFVVGLVIAYVLHRPTRFLSRKTHLPYKLTAILMVVLFFGIIGTLIALLGIKLVSSVGSLVGNLPALYTRYLEPLLRSCFDWLDGLLGRFDLTLLSALQEIETQLVQYVGSIVSNLSVYLMGVISSVATSLPGLFLKVVLLIISTFFITIDYQKLSAFCLNQFSEKSKAVVLQIKNYLIGTLFVCIRSYALIMFITFVELSIGLSIIGIRHALLISLCISICDILPVLGTGTVLIPWTVISLFRGKFSLALGLIILYVAITVIRNIIEPKIVGGQLGLHPIVTLASMFVGVQLFGILGLFGFPILLSLLTYLNKNGVIHLFKDTPDQQTE